MRSLPPNPLEYSLNAVWLGNVYQFLFVRALGLGIIGCSYRFGCRIARRVSSPSLCMCTKRMTIKMYQSALAITALAMSLLLAETAAQASLQPGSEQLAGLEVVSTGLSMSQTDLEPTVPAEAIADIDHTSAGEFSDSTGELLKQTEDRVAQDFTPPVSDTFSPLSDEEIRQQLLINPNAVLDDRPQPVPSSSFLTPSAYGADWGDVFVGASLATDGNRSKFDGSASVGFGVGDAVNSVGLEVSAGIISLDGFADDGIVGFKLHRTFPAANNLAIAVGWSNALKWGAANRADDTFYGVATSRFDLRRGQPNPMPLTVSLGAGTGAFRSTGAIAAKNNAPNVFGSVSLRVQPEVSTTASWTGSGLGLATSLAPFEVPLIFTVGLSDVTGNTAEGIRLIGSVGYGYSF